MMKPFLHWLAILWLLCTPGVIWGQQGLQAVISGQRQQVLPLGYSTREILLLRPNGSMFSVEPDEVLQPQIIPRFQPASQSSLRGELLREFGNGFEVTGTGSYLVVHPRGSKDLWAGRFEDLYRSMTFFFNSRGLPLSRSQFPLAAIVFYSKSQYESFSRKTFGSSMSNAYGYYMPSTNRVYLYDATQGSGDKSGEWAENLATVMHEAAHQTAFNTGVHRRGGPNPRWVVEGLGCLFEARGIYDSLHYRNQTDRLNHGRLSDYRSSVMGQSQDVISSMVIADKSFQFDPGRSYAAAWALTFYLSEREPRPYMQYLKSIYAREPLTAYSDRDRLLEFSKYFGKDFRMLAAKVDRFIDSLPK